MDFLRSCTTNVLPLFSVGICAKLVAASMLTDNQDAEPELRFDAYEGPGEEESLSIETEEEQGIEGIYSVSRVERLLQDHGALYYLEKSAEVCNVWVFQSTDPVQMMMEDTSWRCESRSLYRMGGI